MSGRLRDRQASEIAELDQFRHLGLRRRQPGQIELLGTLPDAEVAQRIGRPVHAVRLKRTRLGIPTARDGRRRENRVGKARAKRRESCPNDYRGPRYTRPIRR